MSASPWFAVCFRSTSALRLGLSDAQPDLGEVIALRIRVEPRAQLCRARISVELGPGLDLVAGHLGRELEHEIGQHLFLPLELRRMDEVPTWVTATVSGIHPRAGKQVTYTYRVSILGAPDSIEPGDAAVDPALAPSPEALPHEG